LLGVLLLDEPLNSHTVVAMLLILASIGMVTSAASAWRLINPPVRLRNIPSVASSHLTALAHLLAFGVMFLNAHASAAAVREEARHLR
jgi:hypothetical protein